MNEADRRKDSKKNLVLSTIVLILTLVIKRFHQHALYCITMRKNYRKKQGSNYPFLDMYIQRAEVQPNYISMN